MINLAAVGLRPGQQPVDPQGAGQQVLENVGEERRKSQSLTFAGPAGTDFLFKLRWLTLGNIGVF